MHGVGMDIATVLEQIKAGDDTAFETLIIQYEPLLHASVRRTVAKQPLLQEEQGEMLQEARCALYRAALSFSVSQANVTFGLYAEICIRNALTSKFLRPLEKEQFPLASISPPNMITETFSFLRSSSATIMEFVTALMFKWFGRFCAINKPTVADGMYTTSLFLIIATAALAISK